MLLRVFMAVRDSVAAWLGREEFTEIGTVRRLEELDAEV